MDVDTEIKVKVEPISEDTKPMDIDTSGNGVIGEVTTCKFTFILGFRVNSLFSIFCTTKRRK